MIPGIFLLRKKLDAQEKKTEVSIAGSRAMGLKAQVIPALLPF